MAEAYIRLAVAPEYETVAGKYFAKKFKGVKVYKPAYDQAVRKMLWDVSAEMIHPKRVHA